MEEDARGPSLREGWRATRLSFDASQVDKDGEDKWLSSWIWLNGDGESWRTLERCRTAEGFTGERLRPAH
uniref:Uncharacterized protein n=1 Tax=Cucumis melo TaxID=3656 RepID=A0A9I9DWY0_CUCME